MGLRSMNVKNGGTFAMKKSKIGTKKVSATVSAKLPVAVSSEENMVSNRGTLIRFLLRVAIRRC